jgi:hypothetical protein
VSKISSRSREVAERIRDRVPFQTYGALRATEEINHCPDSGRLNNDERDRLHTQWNWGNGSMYVVWSYGTPIAWWTERDGWHRVAQKFSMTTSHHQGKLYLIDTCREVA